MNRGAHELGFGPGLNSYEARFIFVYHGLRPRPKHGPIYF